jgi:hypothetical protein
MGFSSPPPDVTTRCPVFPFKGHAVNYTAAPIHKGLHLGADTEVEQIFSLMFYIGIITEMPFAAVPRIKTVLVSERKL